MGIIYRPHSTSPPHSAKAKPKERAAAKQWKAAEEAKAPEEKLDQENEEAENVVNFKITMDKIKAPKAAATEKAAAATHGRNCAHSFM